jgi:hypothetical protein
MTPAQCRAARGLLDRNWLAEAAQVSVVTIRNFENGEISPHRATPAMMQRALEDAGVEFIPESGGGSGVRWRRPR